MRNKFILGMATAGILLSVACAQKVEKEQTFEEMSKPIVTSELMEAKVNEVITNRSENVIKAIEAQMNAQVKDYLDENLNDSDRADMAEAGQVVSDVDMKCSVFVNDVLEVAKENIEGLNLKMAEKVDTTAIETKLEEKEVNGKVDVIKLNTKKAEASQYTATVNIECEGNNEIITVKSNAQGQTAFDIDKVNGAIMKNIIVGKATPKEKADLIKKAKENIVKLKFVDGVMVEVVTGDLLVDGKLSLATTIVDDQVLAIKAKEQECDEVRSATLLAVGEVEASLREKYNLCLDDKEKLEAMADTDLGFFSLMDRNTLDSEEGMTLSIELSNEQMAKLNLVNEPVNVADLKAVEMMKGNDAIAKEYQQKAAAAQTKIAADINTKIAQKAIVGNKLVNDQAQAEADAKAKADEEKAAQEAAAELQNTDAQDQNAEETEDTTKA
ncbi:MAG: hypothetical protein VX583_03275 [Bdellovibrionota bacterium]|nr:hypothetical protein [Pseudobdellovibrionaceae bacterium]|tara:strand:+ start:7280 stop:8602 length:1323 start_codon:yes stop_codon:yes gene_type:complete